MSLLYYIISQMKEVRFEPRFNELSCHKETVRLLCGPVLAKCNWKTIFCGHYRSLFNHSDVIDPQSYRLR